MDLLTSHFYNRGIERSHDIALVSAVGMFYNKVMLMETEGWRLLSLTLL